MKGTTYNICSIQYQLQDNARYTHTLIVILRLQINTLTLTLLKFCPDKRQ